MERTAICKLLFFFLNFVRLITTITSQSDPNFFDRQCSENRNYTNNSTFKQNLDTALSSIRSSAQTEISEYGFYNASVGNEDPERANVMAYCRGLVPLETCRSCVINSTRKIIETCPNQKEGVVWYDTCQIRYSNNSIYGVRDSAVMRAIMNTGKASDPMGFIQTLRSLLDRLRSEAAAGNSIRKSGNGEEEVPSPSFDTIYGLLDCSPDLGFMECDGCLRQLQHYVPNCCNASIGARLTTLSCQLQFEIGPIYEPLPPSPPPPAPPPSLVTDNSSPPSPQGGNNRDVIRTILMIVLPIGVLLLLIFAICLFLRMRRQKFKMVLEKPQILSDRFEVTGEINNSETLQLEFDNIRAATNDFSIQNKLGEGGFGTVYRGRLSNGQEIAVKRLSRGSAQGDLEFKNEVILVAKLQHRNLVRLLGFTLHGKERLLIYEFVPNASLDQFIFDPIKRTLLDWGRRYKIINGVARGILYLHEDSRLRIIHRDLKASNILLDAEMNPKIADFGMAKLFELDETQGNTSRIVGTYGYMAPEYLKHGHFSVKSDVYSFGVLILEIVSGQKNNCFKYGEVVEDLLSYTWKSWRAETAYNVIDSTLNSGSRTEMMRCIHIGLLCTQEKVADRPNMASVVLMLSSSSLTLPLPSKPPFFFNSDIDQTNSDHIRSTEEEALQHSNHEVSISDIDPR